MNTTEVLLLEQIRRGAHAKVKRNGQFPSHCAFVRGRVGVGERMEKKFQSRRSAAP